MIGDYRTVLIFKTSAPSHSLKYCVVKAVNSDKNCNQHFKNNLSYKTKLRRPYQQRGGRLVDTKNREATKMVMMSQTVVGSSSTVMLTSGATGRIRALFSLRALRSLLMLLNAFVLLLVLPFRGRRRVTSTDKSGKEEKQVVGKSPVVRVPATIVPWKSSSGGCASTLMAVAVDQEALVRRAMAIKRVMDDVVDSLRDYSLFMTKRGQTIFAQSWTPTAEKIRGIVVLLHGLNEHSGRYGNFAKLLNSNGFKVYGLDWIGHGGTDGLHAFVHSLDDAVNDTKVFLERVLKENPELPCFFFGHSTGAAIVLKALLDPKIEAKVAGAVMTSPAVGVQASHPIFVVLAPIFAFLFPRFQFGAANKKGMPVCWDPAALVAKYSDPLVYTGSIRVRTGYEILRLTAYLQQNLNKLTVPFFVLHGAADTVTDPDASQKLYNEASSSDKTIKLYDGLLHDLLFELERDAISEEIIQWLNSRV